jgi:GMP synthase-like glutamine amidotransferase
MKPSTLKPIVIFRHLECEGPGYLEQVLRQHQLPFDMVCIDRNDPIPQNIEHCSALIFMGGPMSVNDDLPWIAQELSLIRQAVAADLPVLGHCLGGQLISKALGGSIGANPVKEIGWLPVSKINNDAASDWLAELPEEFTAFHWHGETFSIPEGATPILQSRDCANQGFVTGNTLALQCHVEMTKEMVQEWTKLHAHEIRETSATIQSATEMTTEIDDKIAALQVQADRLYRRWLRPLM